MNNSPDDLSNVREYRGSSHIQTANGSALPNIAVGDTSSYFKDVLISPEFSFFWPALWTKIMMYILLLVVFVVQDQMSGNW